MRFESIIKPPESNIIKSGRIILRPSEQIGKRSCDERMIVVLRGIATISLPSSSHIVNPGETFFIPQDVQHNIVNNSDHNLEYVYIVGLKKSVPYYQESSQDQSKQE